MRKKWLVLMVCGLRLLAAERTRDWQAGQVVESKALTDARDHAIATAEKTYLVKGSIPNEDQSLEVGASVRFAVEDKTMFISIAGKEYKLQVLGVRSGGVKLAPLSASQYAVFPAPAPASPAPPAPAPAPPAAPPAPKVAAAPAPPPAPVAPAPPKAPVSAPPSVAAASAPAPPASDALDNDAIVKMVVGGLKEDTVVSVIQARAGKYALDSKALQGLKAAGVPPSVIAAMTAKMKR
jgi:hypothetical protein